MAYTTTDDVALFLNIDAGTLSDLEDQQISMLIPMVDGVIDNYCGYAIGAADYTNKKYSGDGTSALDLGIYPINTVTKVEEIAADGTTTDQTANIEIGDDGFIQFTAASGQSFTSGTSNYLITFNAGYPLTPSEIKYAATYLVAINFTRINQNLIGISEQGATDMNTKYDSIELPVLVKRVLDRYRKISIF